MRTLIMIRHAKSSSAKFLQSDFDRVLNDRGEQDAADMGKKLNRLQLIPDLIIASNAKRTRQTAKRIAKEVGYIGNIQWEEKLYHCAPEAFEEVIECLGDKVNTLFMVGHNPGITDFVNVLSPEFKIDNLPTCGMAGVQIIAESWKEFPNVKRKVFLFEYPGKHDDT